MVEFKPMKPEELKRLQQAKKQRDKERKDLELLNRKHLANVRVKQKNQVHVQGLTTKIANEDTLAQLKTSDLFSQYGRIQKMFMSRRTGPTNLYTPDSRYQHVNLYINFSRNNEALACIQGVDGLTLPDGHRLKATLGSTKYCASFLRGLKCSNDNCTGAHELAEEVDGGGAAAREEMSTARHAQKESEHRYSSKVNLSHQAHPSSSTSFHPIPSGAALPATASWAAKSTPHSQPASPNPIHLVTSHGPSAHRPFQKSPGIPGPSKSSHLLPIKSRPSPSEDVNSRSVESSSHPSGHSTDHKTTASSSNPEAQSTQESQASSSQKDQAPSQGESAKDAGASIPPDSEGGNTVTTSSKALSQNTLSSHSHPPGLLPPGLTTHSTAVTANRSVPSLPPGLTLPRHSIDESSSHSWEKSSYLNSSFESKRPVKSWIDPLSDDLNNVLSSFSPSFGDSRLSIFPNTNDSPFDSSGLLGSLGYSGTFNPFADTDFPLSNQFKERDSLFGQDPPTPRPESSLNHRRGSRFGFARRDSTGVSGIASSPLRSIFSHQSHDTGSPKASLGQTQRKAVPISTSRAQESSTHVPSNTTGDGAPDASVLFPGVNLSASYSANALPAALARGVRSPGVAGSVGMQSIDAQITSFQPLSAAHPRDTVGVQHGRSGFVNRQTAISPTSFAHMHSSNPHEHMNPNLHANRERRLDLGGAAGFNLSGHYAPSNEMNSEFQDPAILNIRMANSANGNSNGVYLGAMVQGGVEAGNHSGLNEIHPPFSLSNNGFNHLMAANRANPTAGYRPNTNSIPGASNSLGAGNEAGGIPGQFGGFPGVLHPPPVSVNGHPNSIGAGNLGGRLAQQPTPVANQSFYHHSAGNPGTIVGAGLMGRW